MSDDEQSRPLPPYAGTEADTTLGFLEFLRATVAWKTDGLDAEQLARTHPPSTMTLGGLLKHLAFVEDWWFSYKFLGEPQREPWASVDWRAQPDWDWDTAADHTPDELRALWRAAVERSRTTAAGVDLGTLAKSPLRDGEVSLRWIVVHMIEEYARHAGHADLIRESVDGLTGE